MTKLRVSIIGLGRIAEHYLNILNSKNFNNVILSSVCDKKKQILNKFLKKNKKVSVFSNLDSLLKHDIPDLLIIATPSGIHYKNAKLALNKGCNILIEKPGGFNTKEIYSLYKNSLKYNCNLWYSCGTLKLSKGI